MQYSLTVTTGPTEEPVSLEVAKTHLRIDHDEEDSNILAAIKAARQYAEAHTGRYFLSQTVRVKLQEWPCDGVIRLSAFGPNDVSAVSAFTYRDSAGASQTLSASLYQTEFAANPPEIALAPNQTWPLLEYGRRWPVTIDLTVGAVSPAALDARIGQAILLTLGLWDEERGDQNVLIAKGLPPAAHRLLDSIWSGNYS